MLVFRICGVKQKLYVFSLHRNPDLDDRIFNCLVPAMAAVQAEGVRASLVFEADFTCHHQKWLSSIQLLIVMVSQPLNSQLRLVAISWLSARPMVVVEHMTY